MFQIKVHKGRLVFSGETTDECIRKYFGYYGHVLPEDQGVEESDRWKSAVSRGVVVSDKFL